MAILALAAGEGGQHLQHQPREKNSNPGKRKVSMLSLKCRSQGCSKIQGSSPCCLPHFVFWSTSGNHLLQWADVMRRDARAWYSRLQTCNRKQLAVANVIKYIQRKYSSILIARDQVEGVVRFVCANRPGTRFVSCTGWTRILQRPRPDRHLHTPACAPRFVNRMSSLWKFEVIIDIHADIHEQLMIYQRSRRPL